MHVGIKNLFFMMKMESENLDKSDFILKNKGKRQISIFDGENPWINGGNHFGIVSIEFEQAGGSKDDLEMALA
jgi:hypothetical protein